MVIWGKQIILYLSEKKQVEDMETIRKESFRPDYTNILKVLCNERPDYLPLYEHHIDAPFISKALGREVSAEGKTGEDLVEHYRTVIGFWRDHTYDAFDYEAAICEIFPGHGSGNSIPEYASVEGFEAMVDAVKEIRRRER